jgi:predicted O-linked N-acetylglucosamine transferase (SPINDLY family)
MCPDAMTHRYQRAADEWRDIAAASDGAVAELIRRDQVDILVDLNQHTAGSRLQVFARKPAPVQVSWLGYPGSAGLPGIDYRMTDPYVDPPGAGKGPFPDMPVRLPHCFLCFEPPAPSPEVAPLPSQSAGRVTFGSLNNFSKTNPAVIALWSRILLEVGGSRLLLSSREGAHRERTRAEFKRHGVAGDRIEWYTPGAYAAYLAAYHRIDVGLDPFPYNGMTTSMDSAWMGVPFVTLVGNTGVGRTGWGILVNLGLSELVASTPEQYVRIAVDLAGDQARLSELRATLRERLRASPLMDAARFARDMEAAYRAMWRRWCAR